MAHARRIIDEVSVRKGWKMSIFEAIPDVSVRIDRWTLSTDLPTLYSVLEGSRAVRSAQLVRAMSVSGHAMDYVCRSTVKDHDNPLLGLNTNDLNSQRR